MFAGFAPFTLASRYIPLGNYSRGVLPRPDRPLATAGAVLARWSKASPRPRHRPFATQKNFEVTVGLRRSRAIPGPAVADSSSRRSPTCFAKRLRGPVSTLVLTVTSKFFLLLSLVDLRSLPDDRVCLNSAVPSTGAPLKPLCEGARGRHVSGSLAPRPALWRPDAIARCAALR